MKHNQLDFKNRKKLLIIVFSLLLAIILLIFGILLLNNAIGQGLYKNDGAAVDGEYQDPLTILQNQMQEQADNSAFIIQILTKPVFTDGAAEGELYIYNDTANTCGLSVSITLDEDGTEVYRSKVLKPGEGIEYDKLSTVLPKGKYPATALFTAINLNDNTLIGNAAAGLTITVEKDIAAVNHIKLENAVGEEPIK